MLARSALCGAELGYFFWKLLPTIGHSALGGWRIPRFRFKQKHRIIISCKVKINAYKLRILWQPLDASEDAYVS